MRILIAEDDFTSRNMLSAVLHKLGHEAVETVDGLETWDVLQRPDAPKLAILDRMMPGMGGLEICSRIRSRNKGVYTYVLILTAKGSSFDIDTGFAAGADDYLVKPVDPVQLKQRLRVAERIVAYEESQAGSREQLAKFANEMQILAEERARQLVHADRMVTLGVLSAGIAHEINNPVAFIAGNTQTMERAWAKLATQLATPQGNQELEFIIEEFPKMLAGIRKGVDRISRIVSALRNYARQDIPDKKPLSLMEVVETALELCRNALKYNVTVHNCLPETLPEALGDKHQIEQVLVNMFTNATDAMAGQKNGELHIHAAVEGAMVRIILRDSGPGIKQEVLDRVFDPFFTTKEEGKGTGLGLSISKGIIEEHYGRLEARNVPDGGAEFSFTLPVAAGGDATSGKDSFL